MQIKGLINVLIDMFRQVYANISHYIGICGIFMVCTTPYRQYSHCLATNIIIIHTHRSHKIIGEQKLQICQKCDSVTMILASTDHIISWNWNKEVYITIYNISVAIHLWPYNPSPRPFSGCYGNHRLKNLRNIQNMCILPKM